MARVVVHDEKEPLEVNVGGESKWICMCGLSDSKPFCDGSHKKAGDEEDGGVYVYEGDSRVRLK